MMIYNNEFRQTNRQTDRQTDRQNLAGIKGGRTLPTGISNRNEKATILQ